MRIARAAGCRPYSQLCRRGGYQPPVAMRMRNVALRQIMICRAGALLPPERAGMEPRPYDCLPEEVYWLVQHFVNTVEMPASVTIIQNQQTAIDDIKGFVKSQVSVVVFNYQSFA